MDSNNSVAHAKHRGQETFGKWAENAAVIVKGKADRMEDDVVSPTYEAYQKFAKTYPAASFFVTTLAALSLVPIISYLVFAIVVFGSFIFVGVSTAILISLGICAFIGSFLLLTLAFTFGVAVFATSIYLGISLTSRLRFHLQSEEGGGIKGWFEESTARFGLNPPAKDDANVVKEIEDSDSDIAVEDQRTIEPKVESDEWHRLNRGESPNQPGL